MNEPIPPKPTDIDLAMEPIEPPAMNFELKFDSPPPLPEPVPELVLPPVPEQLVQLVPEPTELVANEMLDSQYISATIEHPELPLPTAKVLPEPPVVEPIHPQPKKVAPQWLELEPDDKSDAVPHEAHEVATGQPGWRIVAASVRGKLHAHKGQYREDSFAHGCVDGWTILAVSDGAGSAKLSRIGSRIACDTALSVLQSQLKDYTFSPVEDDAQPSQGDLLRMRGLLEMAGQKALHAIKGEAHDRGTPLKEFNCTLLVVIHTIWHDKHVVAVLQVGDGAIGLASPEWDHAFKRLGIADHGEYSSETRFLTTPGMDLEFHNRVLFSLPKELRAIAVMTDGVSDDFFPEDQRLGEVFYGQPIPNITMKHGGPVLGLMHGIAHEAQAGAALRDWLRYERRGSSDDRTLVLMHRE